MSLGGDEKITNDPNSDSKDPSSPLAKEIGNLVLRLRGVGSSRVASRLHELCDKEIFSKMNELLSTTRTRSLSHTNESDEMIIAEDSRASVTRKDFKTLDNRNWLNDQVIDYYLGMISDRSEKNSSLPKVYCVSSFFYASILSHGYKNVKRWLRKVDLFSFDIVFIPIKDKDHWTLMVVDIAKRKLNYLDSLFLNNLAPAMTIKDFLIDYAKEKDTDVNVTEWEIIVVYDVPGQANSNDCGVFICQYVEYLSRKASIDFAQADAQALRKKMAYEIYTHKLLEI
uniref:Ubiquitin-like protease family profile domain-containing protein n=1 Tax=Acrobeloides nanus TaxID=290746 RepID=A0A914C4X2_9BILA